MVAATAAGGRIAALRRVGNTVHQGRSDMKDEAFTLARFTRETQVTDDGRRWYEDEVNSGAEYSTLGEAIAAAQAYLVQRDEIDRTMWEDHVGIIACAVDFDGMQTGYALGWVTLDGYTEGDYENDERLHGPVVLDTDAQDALAEEIR